MLPPRPLPGPATDGSGEPTPADPIDAQDFVTILTALVSEDTSLRLLYLSTPTLIIGGQGRFYPAGALREMADAVLQPRC